MTANGNKVIRKAVATLALTATVTGCTSVSSTYFHRDETDVRWKKNHIKGVPITLEVPTHARFSIFETTYLVSRSQGDAVAVDKAKRSKANAAEKAKAAAEAADAEKAEKAKAAEEAAAEAARDQSVVDSKTMELVMLDEGRPLKTYNVTYDFITEKKIFGVDFKRPAAGPYSLTANLKNQYFTDVDHRLTDQTIEKAGTVINNLIAQLVPAGGVMPGAGTSKRLVSPPESVASAPIPINSLKCSQVFKLDAPDFEMQVAAFLNEHCCATAEEKVQALAPPASVSAYGQAATIGNSGENAPSAPTEDDARAVNGTSTTPPAGAPVNGHPESSGTNPPLPGRDPTQDGPAGVGPAVEVPLSEPLSLNVRPAVRHVPPPRQFVP